MNSDYDVSNRKTPFISNIPALISIFIAASFIFSTVVTNRYNSMLSEKLFTVFSYSDYLVFAIDFVRPIVLVAYAVLIFSIASMTFYFLSMIAGFVFERAARDVQLWIEKVLSGVQFRPLWRRKMNLPNVVGISLIRSSFRHADKARGKFNATQSESENVKKTIYYGMEIDWAAFPILIWSGPLILIFNSVLHYSRANTLGGSGFGFVIYYLLITIFLLSISALATRKHFFINGNLIKDWSDKNFLAATSAEQAAFTDLKNRNIEFGNFYTSLVLMVMFIISLFAGGNIYGSSLALSLYEDALKTRNTSQQEIASNIRLEGDIIRVVEKGILTFDNSRHNIIFLNNDGNVRAVYRSFLYPDKDANLSAEDLKIRRDLSSSCFSERHPFYVRLRLPDSFTSKVFGRMFKQGPACENLFDIWTSTEVVDG